LEKKNVVAGLGEIGGPILQLLSKKTKAVGYDVNPKLMDNKKFKKLGNTETSFLHICIPFISKYVL